MKKLNYGDHGPSIKAFLKDGHFIRGLIGGRGSGKTRALAEDITGHIWKNAGAKAIVARQTESSQSDSSIDTFIQFFEGLGELYSTNNEVGLFKSWNNGRTFRIPSKLAVERMQEDCKNMKTKSEVANWISSVGDSLCGYLEFRGLPDAEKGKFRGMECSYLALVEADQIVKRQFDLSLACLRWKGTDPLSCDEKGFIRDRCVVLDSNPPSPQHWIAELEMSETSKNESIMRFWHITTYENEHNLPENYIRDTILLPYSSNPAMIERMLYGRYADAFDGTPVYYAFKIHIHEGEDLPFPRGAYLIRGHDVGTNAASVWSAYWSENGVEYWHDLCEYYCERSDTDRHAREVIRITESEFPFWNDRNICSGVMDYIDPAAANSSYTRQINVDGNNVNESAINIFRTYKIYPKYTTKSRGLHETIAVVNRLFERRDKAGNPVYRVDRKGCPRLVRGYHGGYRWASADDRQADKNTPVKGLACDNLDHIQDASRYAKINALRLTKVNVEGAKKSVMSNISKPINAMRRI